MGILLLYLLRREVIAFNKVPHVIAGIGTSIIFFQSPIGLIGCIVGSLLPDIDHPHSTLGKYNPFTCFMQHRGHCHSIVGIVILSSPFLAISQEAAVAVLAGAGSHLIMDKIGSAMHGRRFRIKIW